MGLSRKRNAKIKIKSRVKPRRKKAARSKKLKRSRRNSYKKRQRGGGPSEWCNCQTKDKKKGPTKCDGKLVDTTVMENGKSITRRECSSIPVCTPLDSTPGFCELDEAAPPLTPPLSPM